MEYHGIDMIFQRCAVLSSWNFKSLSLAGHIAARDFSKAINKPEPRRTRLSSFNRLYPFQSLLRQELMSTSVPFQRFSQWIGVRENLQETMVFTIKYRAFL
jgi:hypothetical protein